MRFSSFIYIDDISHMKREPPSSSYISSLVSTNMYRGDVGWDLSSDQTPQSGTLTIVRHEGAGLSNSPRAMLNRR